VTRLPHERFAQGTVDALFEGVDSLALELDGDELPAITMPCWGGGVRLRGVCVGRTWLRVSYVDWEWRKMRMWMMMSSQLGSDLTIYKAVSVEHERNRLTLDICICLTKVAVFDN
jgi:hypothetical protein